MSEALAKDAPSLPGALARRVDQVCDRFEAAWKAAGCMEQRPRIEDYVRDVPEPEHSALLRELLVLEMAQRGRAGETLRLEDYQARFPTLEPQWLASVRQEGCSAEPAASGEWTNPPPAVTPPADCTQEVYEFLAPPQEPGELGRLGPYRVVQVLGVGGMGVVFQAEDLQLKRRVALKVMRPGVLASALARQRFLREAQTCAAIDHEHIVTLLQVGEDRGVPYLAMQLLQGETLEERLKREVKLSPAEVLRIGREIATGLAAAHERGLIHRDIKPANIWLETLPGAGEPSGPRWRVKILDFGLARAFGGEAHLTQSGTIVGTPSYMAPEQAEGGAVDPRSDLFGLGCVLYRLCTGQLPFKGATTMAVLRSLELEQPQPPHLLNLEVPRPLSDLILKLLAKRAEDRYPSARTVVETLEAIREGRAIAARPARRRRRPLVLAAIGLGVLGMVCYLFGPAVLRLTIHRDPAKSVAADGQRDAVAVLPKPLESARPCHFAPQATYPVGFKPYAVAVGDFNGDGKLDLVVSNIADNTVSLLLGNGDGTFQPAVNLRTQAEPHGVAVGDFNGDGKLDFAVANKKSTTVSVFLGNGDGTFRDPRSYATGSNPKGVAVADLNGDGKADLVVANGGDVSVLLGNGDGTFRPAVNYPCRAGGDVTVGGGAVTVADLNGDGKSDLVVPYGTANFVSVLLGNGDGTFRAGVLYAVGSGPGVVVAADFNGDGNLDIAVENVGTHDVSVLLGNGDGTFRREVRYPAGQSPGGLAVGDFNGDGKPDLVVANHNSLNVSVLLGNGDGTFRPAEHYAAGITPAGVAVGDFNGDARTDVVVVNHQGANVSVLLNQPPTPHFRLSANYSVTAGERPVVGVTAVDADNNPEIGYTGSVHYTCSDPQAEFLGGSNATFGAQDNGIRPFLVTLKTVGTQTVTVTDTVMRSRLGTLTIMVLPGPATHLSVSAAPASKAGQSIPVTILARDAFENQASDYQGTVHVSSSDPKAVLPPDYKFVEADNGGRQLPVTLATPGKQTITVSDTNNGTIRGSWDIIVAPAEARPGGQ
jgi:tRNA A-37 threonylcarbamoyl transferase component Bud32